MDVEFAFSFSEETRSKVKDHVYSLVEERMPDYGTGLSPSGGHFFDREEVDGLIDIILDVLEFLGVY